MMGLLRSLMASRVSNAELRGMSSYLVIGGWSGRRKIPVDLISETPESFEIVALEAAFLPGRGILRQGQSAFVPKATVEVDMSPPAGSLPIAS